MKDKTFLVLRKNWPETLDVGRHVTTNRRMYEVQNGKRCVFKRDV